MNFSKRVGIDPRDAAALVRDNHLDLVRVAQQAHLDVGARPGVLARIDEEVAQNLAHPVGIDPAHGGLATVDADRVTAEQRRHVLEDRRDERSEVHAARREAQPARLDERGV